MAKQGGERERLNFNLRENIQEKKHYFIKKKKRERERLANFLISCLKKILYFPPLQFALRLPLFTLVSSTMSQQLTQAKNLGLLSSSVPYIFQAML